MRNNQIIINILFALGLAVLYFLHFYKKPAAMTKHNLTPMAVRDSAVETKEIPGKVLYINIDTVNQKYNYIIKQKAALEKQQAQAEATLKAKGKALETQIMAYQKKAQAGELTAQQAQEAEAKLGQQQQAIMKQQDALSNDLMEKTAKMQEELNKKVKAELKVYLDKYGADYILGYSENGPVLLTNDKLDITNELLDKLNTPASTK